MIRWCRAAWADCSHADHVIASAINNLCRNVFLTTHGIAKLYALHLAKFELIG